MAHLIIYWFLGRGSEGDKVESSSDIKYGPCPPARDWDSRVSGLVFRQTENFCCAPKIRPCKKYGIHHETQTQQSNSRVLHLTFTRLCMTTCTYYNVEHG